MGSVLLHEEVSLLLPISSHYQYILILPLKFLLSLLLLTAARHVSDLDFHSRPPTSDSHPSQLIFTPNRRILLNYFLNLHFYLKPFKAPIPLTINPVCQPSLESPPQWNLLFQISSTQSHHSNPEYSLFLPVHYLSFKPS